MAWRQRSFVEIHPLRAPCSASERLPSQATSLHACLPARLGCWVANKPTIKPRQPASQHQNTDDMLYRQCSRRFSGGGGLAAMCLLGSECFSQVLNDETLYSGTTFTRKNCAGRSRRSGFGEIGANFVSGLRFRRQFEPGRSRRRDGCQASEPATGLAGGRALEQNKLHTFVERSTTDRVEHVDNTIRKTAQHRSTGTRQLAGPSAAGRREEHARTHARRNYRTLARGERVQ